MHSAASRSSHPRVAAFLRGRPRVDAQHKPHGAHVRRPNTGSGRVFDRPVRLSKRTDFQRRYRILRGAGDVSRRKSVSSGARSAASAVAFATSVPEEHSAVSIDLHS